jgi:hypothetical protein
LKEVQELSRSQALIVCTQPSQGCRLQPQSATPASAFAGTLTGVGGDSFGFVTFGTAPDTSTAASISGIHRLKGARSATSTMYQHFLAASQRAPSALTASFSAKGVTRLILMAEISPSSPGCSVLRIVVDYSKYQAQNFHATEIQPR